MGNREKQAYLIILLFSFKQSLCPNQVQLKRLLRKLNKTGFSIVLQKSNTLFTAMSAEMDFGYLK